MKKIIITVAILMAIGATASAYSWDSQSLADLWNRRADLQKAFPGSPYNNSKLEAWAKKYGWKENPDTLYNYYPDKTVIDKLTEQKYEARIDMLESQVAELQKRMAAMPAGQATVILPPLQASPIQQTAQKTKKCFISPSTGVIGKCDDNIQNPQGFGWEEVNFLIK